MSDLPPPTSGLFLEISFRRLLKSCAEIMAGDNKGREDLTAWQRSPVFHHVRPTQFLVTQLPCIHLCPPHTIARGCLACRVAVRGDATGAACGPDGHRRQQKARRKWPATLVLRKVMDVTCWVPLEWFELIEYGCRVPAELLQTYKHHVDGIADQLQPPDVPAFCLPPQRGAAAGIPAATSAATLFRCGCWVYCTSMSTVTT